jgi:hypothetical protein
MDEAVSLGEGVLAARMSDVEGGIAPGVVGAATKEDVGARPAVPAPGEASRVVGAAVELAAVVELAVAVTLLVGPVLDEAGAFGDHQSHHHHPQRGNGGLCGDAEYVTVKLDVTPEEPLVSVMDDVVSSVVPNALVMLIETSCQVEELLSIGPVVPLTVAHAFEKLTVPKLANGKTPEYDDGASTIHSADDLCA